MLKELISQFRSNPKRFFRRTVCRNLPRMLTYGDIVSIREAPQSLPALKTIFEEPFVYHPTDDDHDVLKRNPFFAKQNIILSPVSVYNVPNGLIFPESGLIADESGRFFLESGKSLGYLKSQEDFYRIRSGVRTISDGSYYSTIHCGIQAKSIGHSILDGLSRLYALSQLSCEITLIQTINTSNWNKKMMDSFLPPNVKVKYVSGIKPFRAKSVLLSPYLNNNSCAFWRPKVLQFMKEKFYSFTDAPPAIKKQRFYVWRRNVGGMHGANRRIANEDKLFRMFAKYNITPIALETLSIPEQVKLFRDSELILGVTGSGTALIFLALKAAMITIFPNGNNQVHDLMVWDWSLARSADLLYCPVYHSYSAMPSEFEVDIDRVEQAIGKALELLKRQH